jgi:hypothetical protein
LKLQTDFSAAVHLNRRRVLYRFRGLPSLAWVDWVRLGCVCCLVCLGILLFFEIVQPFEAGISQYRLGADSVAYFAAAKILREGSGTIQFIAVSGSLIGPPLEAFFLRTPFWVMVCNISLFFLAIKLCAPVQGLNRSKLAFLLALNATTIVSLITLNKEIFALVSTLLLARYLYSGNRSKVLLGAILIVGILARWQQTAITILFLFFRRENSIFRRHPWITVISLTVLIGFAYSVTLQLFPSALHWTTYQAQDGGAILFLNRVQASFGYPLVVIPKALMALYNRMLTPGYFLTDYWQQDFSDLANQYVIHLQCLMMLIVSIAAFWTGRLSIRRPIPFFIVLYLVVTAANAFIQSRYQYPVYVLLCFDLARREDCLPSPLKLRLRLNHCLSWSLLHPERKRPQALDASVKPIV